MKRFNLTAPCVFGVEGILADELRRMGAEEVRAENGRVLFCGSEEMIARANIRSRFAERIMINVGEFYAETFDELFEGVKGLPFEEYIGKTDEFPVKGWSINSALHSIPDCQSIVKKAIVERLKTKYKISWFEETGAKVQVQFSILKNRVSVMIDTTGFGLHKRGYRAKSNDAPIKETLAAAMCDQARIFPDAKIYDPMCGSGTILIEAALMAKKYSPGLKNFFAAERFFFSDRKVWQSERNLAKDMILTDIDFKAVGYDIDPECVKLTLENAKKAGVEKYVSAFVRDIKDFELEDNYAKVITNPPYGERLLDIKKAQEIYTVMGKVFRRENNNKFFIISPQDDFENYFGAVADKRRKLYNGMIKCQLYMYLKGK